MRTQMFRVWALGVAVASLGFGTGCQQREARAAEPAFTDLVPQVADTTPPAEAPDPFPDAAGAPGLEKSTNAAPPKMVQAPVLPEDLKVSPALEEILKLAQAGVSEEVLLSYINNSSHLFNANSDAIVYLHDLGVSDNVITALISHDASPELQAQKLAAGAVKPLPPGAALNTPADVYPPSVAETTPAPAEATPDPQVETVVQTNYVVQQVEQPASVTYFYSSLAPYGTWVEVDGYGLCWQPTVAVHNPGWRPYGDHGRWIWSDAGWYWYSDYSWGWAPFHYGRWCSYPRLGWLWVPDTHWGPSWVSWRYSSSYCGWAPLPPGCYYRGGGLWYGGVSVGVGFSFGFGWSDYCYVPLNRFCDRNVGLHYARGDHARRIHGGTTVVNNYVNGNNNTIINRGIGRERVATAVRGQVPTATVREASVRANGRREQLVNNGSSMAIVRPALPERPPRSHVNIPTRRVSASADNTAGAVPNRGFGARARGSAVDSSSPNSAAIASRRGAARNDTAERALERSAGTTPTARTETPQASRPGISTDRRSRSEGVTTPGNRGSDSTTVRPNAPAVRNFSGNRDNGSSGATTPRSGPTVIARNNTPATPAPSSPRTQVRTPVTSTPAPSTAPRSAAVPNSTARRGEAVRTYGNPSPAVRNTPLPQSPAVRSTPAPSTPVNRPGLSPSSSINRPEPSRSAPSYSAPPRSAPSYSAPARSAPSYSAPRSAPSYSAPARPASSYSAPVRSAPSYSAPSSPARSAPSYSAPAARSSSSSGGGGRGGYSSGGGGGGLGGRNR